MIRGVWRKLFPPPPKRELIGLGAREYVISAGEKQGDNRSATFFFYRTGDVRTVEIVPEERSHGALEVRSLYEDDMRLWEDCNHLPKWADPVVARIIEDSK